MSKYSTVARAAIEAAATEQGWEISLNEPTEMHLVRAGGWVIYVGFGARGGIIETAFGRQRYRTNDRLALVLRWLREFGNQPNTARVRVVVGAAEVVPGDQITNSNGKRVRIFHRVYDHPGRAYILKTQTLDGQPSHGITQRAGTTVSVWREGNEA